MAQLRVELRQELRVRVAAPGVVIHPLVAGGAHADGQFLGRLGAGEHRWHPIRAFHPQPGGVEHLGAGPQAMQDLAEEPFAGIIASALGQVVGAKLARQRRDLRRFGDTRVVFPKPGHRRGIPGEPAVKRQRPSAAVHWDRGAAGRVHPDSNDLVRRKTPHRPPGQRQRLLDRDFRPGHIVRRVLSRQVRIARQDDPLAAVLKGPNGRGHLAPVGDVDNQGAYGVGAVVEAEGVLGCAHGPLS